MSGRRGGKEQGGERSVKRGERALNYEREALLNGRKGLKGTGRREKEVFSGGESGTLS